MPHVVFVSPFFLPTTLRFVHAVADLPGVRVGLISQDPAERLEPSLRRKIELHYRIDDGLDVGQLARATQWMRDRFGAVDLLLGTLEQLQVPLAEVREALGIAGMGVEAARNFREKDRMKDVLQGAGLPCARHRLLTTVEEGVDFTGRLGFPVVCKPQSGAGAKSTFQVDSKEQLEQLLGEWNVSPSQPVQCEEFIVGLERSFEVVSIRGRRVWHSLTRYDPGPLEVLRNPWIQWTVLLPREIDDPGYDEVRRVGFAALDSLGMDTGISHMEWFRRRDNGVVVSEVGARPPGAQIMTLTGLAHDIDMYRAWARLVVYEQWTTPQRRYAAGAAFLRGQGKGDRVVAIHGLDAANQKVGHLVAEARLPRVGQSRADSYEGEGYVLLRHAETSVVEKGLKELISTVVVELG